MHHWRPKGCYDEVKRDFRMDCMWIWSFEWIASGYGYGYGVDMDVDADLDTVIRCSKKLQYILAWE